MICNHAFDRSRSMYVLIRNLGKGKCITPFIVADIFVPCHLSAVTLFKKSSMNVHRHVGDKLWKTNMKLTIMNH